MKSSLRLGVLFAGASIFGGAAFLIACSDDTSISTTDGGTDAPITPTDAPVGDGGPDTAPPFDGGFVVDTFDKVIAKELCGALARCCYGTATPAEGGVDGGSFDATECEKRFGSIGFEGSNADKPAVDAGHVALDQLSADTCIKKIKAMTCDLPGAEFKAIRTACYGAYAGTVAMGGACTSSIECAPGQFCKTVGDAGTGTCDAVRAVDSPCGDFNTDRAEEACSYRAGGNTGNYCKFADIATGTFLPATDWKCAPSLPAGSDCATSLWCNETVCSQASTCETPNEYFASSCSAFVK